MFFLALSGCSDDDVDVDIVKSGTMRFNKTTTIGQAFDNWKSCEAAGWNSFKTESGIRVVQFQCEHKIDKYLNSFNKAVERHVLVGDADDQARFDKIVDRVVKSKALDIKSIVQNFDFTINMDDTFQAESVTLVTTWKDGATYSANNSPVKQFQLAYSNKMKFDPNFFDTRDKYTGPNRAIKKRYSYLRMKEDADQ